MSNIASWFIKVSIIYLLVGMILGIYMAASGNHVQAPTHTHINLLGWATLALSGLVYRAWPELGAGVLPRLHFWILNIGVLGMVVGLALMFGGRPEMVPVTAASSVIVLIGVALFAIILFRARLSNT